MGNFMSERVRNYVSDKPSNLGNYVTADNGGPGGDIAQKTVGNGRGLRSRVVPVDFLSDDQAAAYGRFVGSPSRLELERFCFLDDTDQELVGRHRGDHNRLGFSLQLVTVRALGTFLTDPLDVPSAVVHYLAEQLGIADPSCVKNYLEREKTRFEHQWEIFEHGQWCDFGQAEAELTQWVDDRAWTTGDGPKAIFDGAVGWLRERRVLLPGVTTLTRLVARVADAALQRLWDTVAGLVNAELAGVLVRLLEVTDGARVSDLERLRRGPTAQSGKALAAALDRVAEIIGLGAGPAGLEAGRRGVCWSWPGTG
jgi:hypothetical protein